jgi:hypothetical protein
MLNKGKLRPNSLPVTDYRPAIAKAVEWLGDRYVLAKPIPRSASRPQADHSASRIPRHNTCEDSLTFELNLGWN